jgi:hypothetical protein
VRNFLLSPLAPKGLARLLKYNLVVGLFIFCLLEIWRPYFFLTDDNLSSGLPMFTEMGRHLKSGESPFVSDYIFGGNYNLVRDLSFDNWHPVYFLSSLLADTPARFCILDLSSLVFILLAAGGFTLLGFKLVREFNPGLPVIYLVFFTASYLFSSYILNVTASWTNFLINQSALPWMALGILDRRLLRGTLFIFLASLHEIFGAYAAMTLSNGIFLTLLALGLTVLRRSAIPVSSWVFGNLMAVLASATFLVRVLDGFTHSFRVAGMTLKESTTNNIPAALYPFSFFCGNWTDLVGRWGGEAVVKSADFPHLSVMLACGASWCLLPALFSPAKWRGMEMLLLSLIVLLVVWTIRPLALARIMHELPVLKSMRWPFRECLQLLFFFHLFLLIRHPGLLQGWSPALAVFGLIMFLLPLPFSRVPTLNPLFLDRKEVLSGSAEKFWTQVKTQLQPTDAIITVIDPDLLKKEIVKLPYSLLGTANFPAFYRFRCASGYSPTAPLTQRPLQTDPEFWFGAFGTDQLPRLLHERADLKMIVVDGVNPLRLSLVTPGRRIDLTPYIDQ